MRTTRELATIAIFTSLIIASDFSLTPFPNVKLLDTLVFSIAFVFGFGMGTSVAITSEVIWGFVSPYGPASLINIFTVLGELFFVIAGVLASRVWKQDENRTWGLSLESFYFGAIIAICAFLWDFETNLAMGLIADGFKFTFYALTFEITGASFAIVHEASDFLIGSALAPVAITFFSHTLKRRPLAVSPRAINQEENV